MFKSTRSFLDFDASFSAHPTTGDLVVRADERAIKFAVKSLILTSIYEKPFHPEISTQIKHLLFSNMDDMFVIVMKQVITEILSMYEPRVDLMSVDVNPSYDSNSVYINITFAIKNTTKPLNVDVVLERTR